MADRFQFKLPDIGEGLVEAEVVRWLVGEGEAVREDQPLGELMTDKATVEIPSPRAGRVARILVPEGSRARVGEVLIEIETDAVAPSAASGAAPARAPAPAAPAPPPPAAPAEVAAARPGPQVLATPRTRKLAQELGVNLAAVRGTGPSGRITDEDVWAASRDRTAVPRVAPAAPAAPAPGPAPAPPPPGEERIPIRGIRRRTAEHLRLVMERAVPYTYVEELDATALVALREAAKARAEARGVRLTYLPLILAALVPALRRFPALNATVDDEREEIVQHRDIHIAVAMATDQGLLVPVVKGCADRDIWDLAREIERLAALARAGKIQPADLQGGTFTVTSLGPLGGLFATPVLNYPQVAILGVHRIVKRPVALGGQVVVRDLMHLSLTLDHRIVDGLAGAQFMAELKRLLEQPALLVLER
jgi:pyruvate dehydrogenase E2 component (dihydrolipoamide acetyltransferase)